MIEIVYNEESFEWNELETKPLEDLSELESSFVNDAFANSLIFFELENKRASLYKCTFNGYNIVKHQVYEGETGYKLLREEIEIKEV